MAHIGLNGNITTLDTSKLLGQRPYISLRADRVINLKPQYSADRFGHLCSGYQRLWRSMRDDAHLPGAMPAPSATPTGTSTMAPWELKVRPDSTHLHISHASRVTVRGGR
jgi:hypothetical protein